MSINIKLKQSLRLSSVFVCWQRNRAAGQTTTIGCLNVNIWLCPIRGIDSGGAGGARAPPEFWGSEKGRSLISANQSLAITASTSRF